MVKRKRPINLPFPTWREIQKDLKREEDAGGSPTYCQVYKWFEKWYKQPALIAGQTDMECEVTEGWRKAKP